MKKNLQILIHSLIAIGLVSCGSPMRSTGSLPVSVSSPLPSPDFGTQTDLIQPSLEIPSSSFSVSELSQPIYSVVVPVAVLEQIYGPYPAGLFRADVSIYYSNGAGYCGFTSWEHYVYSSGGYAVGGVATGGYDMNLIPFYPRVPDKKNSDDGSECAYPPGKFKVGTSYYYSNGAGGYCKFRFFIDSTGGSLPTYRQLPVNYQDTFCS